MKKITLFLLAMLPMLAQAQITAEAIIGQCPPWPSLSDLVMYGAHGMEEAPGVAQFKQMCGKVNSHIDNMLSKQADANQNATNAYSDRMLRQQTGMSTGQAKNLSQADAKRQGEAKANTTLGKLGIKKDASQLKNTSKKEREQMGSDIARKQTGLSMDELKALQNMSEKEQLAYLQQNGRMDKIAVGSSSTSTKRSGQTVDMSMAQKMNDLSPKMQAAMQNILDFENAILAEQNELREQARKLWETKYARKAKELSAEAMKWDIHEGNGTAEENAKAAAANAAERAWKEQYYREVVSPWMEMCGRQRDKAKTLLPDARVIDEYNALVAQLSGIPPLMEHEKEIYVARMVFGCHAGVTGFSSDQ